MFRELTVTFAILQSYEVVRSWVFLGRPRPGQASADTMSARAQDAPPRSGIGIRLQPIDVAARAWLTVTLVELRQKYHKSGVASLNMAMMAITHPGNIRNQLEGCPDELSQAIQDTAREAVLRVFNRYILDDSGSTIEDNDTRGVLHTFLNADLDNNDPHNYNEKIDSYLGPGGDFVQYAKEFKHTRLRWYKQTKEALGGPTSSTCLPLSAEHCQISRQGVIKWFNNGYQGNVTWTFSNVTDVEDPTLGRPVAPHSTYCLPTPLPSGNFVLTADDISALMTLQHLPLDERGVVVKQDGTSTDAAGPSGSSHQIKRTCEFTAEQVNEMVARAQPSTASTRAADPAVLPPGPNSSGSPDRHKRALELSALELTDEDAKELIRKEAAFKARRRRCPPPPSAVLPEWRKEDVVQEEVAVEEGPGSDLSLPVPSRSSAGKRPARIQAPAAASTLPYPRNSSEAALAPGLRLIAAIEDARRAVAFHDVCD